MLINGLLRWGTGVALVVVLSLALNAPGTLTLAQTPSAQITSSPFGLNDSPNRQVGESSGFVAGTGNVTQGAKTFVGAGEGNLTGGDFSTIPGGLRNLSGGPGSSIGGGIQNLTAGEGSTVPGGIRNIARGETSMAFGLQSFAEGDRSLAAGTMAHAKHQGSFVWADGTSTTFESALDNEFAIRASGGARIEVGQARLQVTQDDVLFFPRPNTIPFSMGYLINKDTMQSFQIHDLEQDNLRLKADYAALQMKVDDQSQRLAALEQALGIVVPN